MGEKLQPVTRIQHVRDREGKKGKRKRENVASALAIFETF